MLLILAKLRFLGGRERSLCEKAFLLAFAKIATITLGELMTDTFTKTERSRIMRAVRSKGTTAEKKCERLLRFLRLSFRRHVADLPGQPDFVLEGSSRLVVFVNGCFWHAHKGCKNSVLPTSNADYWYLLKRDQFRMGQQNPQYRNGKPDSEPTSGTTSPIYFSLFTRVLLSVGGHVNDDKLLPKGALL